MVWTTSKTLGSSVSRPCLSGERTVWKKTCMNKVVIRSSLGQTTLRRRGKKQSTNQPQKCLKNKEGKSFFVLFVCHSFHLWMALICEEFRKEKCRVLNLGKKNPATSTGWGKRKAAWQKRTWGFGIWTKLNMSHYRVLMAKAANCILGCRRQSVSSTGSDPALLHSPGEATSSGNARSCSAGMGWREPVVHTRDCGLRGLGLFDGTAKEANRHKRGHILQAWNDKALFLSKRLKNPTIKPREEATLKICFGKKAAQWCRIKLNSAQLLWAASKTTLMKERLQQKCFEWEPCPAPLAHGNGKGLRHSRVSGFLEEKLITISRLKRDQIKNRIELLRSEEDGKSVLVNLTGGPYASDCIWG